MPVISKQLHGEKVLVKQIASVLLTVVVGWWGSEALSQAPPSGDTHSELAGVILRSAGVKEGLCVHLGCGDGKLTAALGAASKLLVQGIDPNPSLVGRARQHIQLQGIYGRVSVERASLARLPYAENLVNLVVADGFKTLLAQGLSLKEVMRVLCPGGVAYLGDRRGSGLTEDELGAELAAVGIGQFEIVKSGGVWAKVRKPRPANMDEWTHWRYGPEGNAVSRDTAVGVPSGIRWIASPRAWPRVHSLGLHAVVSANGRLFYVFDEGPPGVNVAPRLHLVARDAYNGLLLWKRPISVKLDRRRPLQLPFKGSGKFNMFTLVAVEDSVFAVLSPDAPLVKLDAASGKVVMTYEGTSPDQVVCHQGNLILTSKTGVIRSVEAATGRLRWSYSPAGGKLVAGAKFAHAKWTLKVVLGGGQLFFLEKSEEAAEAVSLDLVSGRERWRKSSASWQGSSNPKYEPELIAYHDGILALDDIQGKVRAACALRASDGKYLWSFPYRPVYSRSSSFFQGGLLWVRSIRPSEWVGIDPATGKEKKRIPWSAYGPRRNSKGRCYAYKATDRFILCGDADLLDPEIPKTHYIDGVRGTCGHAFIPANGLLYFLPQDCICRPFLRGFVALTSTESAWEVAKDAQKKRLELGGGAEDKISVEASSGENDWPCYRHDSRRSGSTKVVVAADLKLLWKTKIGLAAAHPDDDYWRTVQQDATITPPVVAYGMVFLASRDAHQVLALDAGTGKLRWSYTVGGRVDLPPTIFEGLCLFGCRDGWVYCLRAKDGELVWRFRGAPFDRRMVVDEQLESPWPVVGSVLVTNGVAYFAAGRHGALDGGVTVYALDPTSGKLLWQQRPPRGNKGFGGLGDALTSDGRFIYLANWQFDPETGGNRKADWSAYWRTADVITKAGKKLRYLQTGPAGFLDGTYSSRTWWCDGRGAGHLLVFNEDRTFGVKAFDPPGWDNFSVMTTPGTGAYKLFAEGGKGAPDWSIKAPVRVQAMLLAGDALFVAGPPDNFQPEGGELWAFRAADGSSLSMLKLEAPPVFDGLAAAEERLYVSTLDGMILCFGEK